MTTDQSGFLYQEETYQIIGCAMDVLNTLGHGLLEKPYENALVVEFEEQGIPYQQQPRFRVVYKTVHVGEYIPDLIVFDKIIVDTKTVKQIGDHEKAQMLNYLRITGLRVGLLVNFRYAKLQWERLVL